MNGNNKHLIFNVIPLITGVLAILGVVVMTVMFVIGPDKDMAQDIALIQKDIQTIKTNHLVHIQQAIDNNTVNSKANREDIINIEKKLDRIIILLELHDNNMSFDH